MTKKPRFISQVDRKNIAGANISQLRQQSGREFCQMLRDSTGLSISEQTLYKIEQGKRAIYDYELLFIAKLLGVSVDYLLQDIPSQ